MFSKESFRVFCPGYIAPAGTCVVTGTRARNRSHPDRHGCMPGPRARWIARKNNGTEYHQCSVAEVYQENVVLNRKYIAAEESGIADQINKGKTMPLVILCLCLPAYILKSWQACTCQVMHCQTVEAAGLRQRGSRIPDLKAYMILSREQGSGLLLLKSSRGMSLCQKTILALSFLSSHFPLPITW